MIRRSLFIVFAILVAMPALALTPPWTAAGTTAVIDESSVPLYALTPPYLGYNATSVGLITAYFNVTDTTATAFPAWNTLELSYFDNALPSQVAATLFRLDKCNGTAVALCTVTSVDASTTTCNRCRFTQLIDFTLYDYYIAATLYRNNNTVSPKLYGLRLF
ncbi:MAG TPA: hypothetical protein VEW48_18300 [Thermoanaerobaculia bacterium]|nr:hypothetical protein [Thermoanaerobaculia bacterium]